MPPHFAFAYAVVLSLLVGISGLFSVAFSNPTPSPSIRDQFNINTDIFERPLRAQIVIPTSLMQKWFDLLKESPAFLSVIRSTTSDRSNTTQRSTDQNKLPFSCSPTSMTTLCCRQYYFNGSDPFRQCIATAKGTGLINPGTPVGPTADGLEKSSSTPGVTSTDADMPTQLVDDPFNIDRDEHMSSCLIKDKVFQSTCCFWLYDGDSKALAACRTWAKKVVDRGIRVCSHADNAKRYKCCDDVFFGRLSLIRACRQRSQVYVDRMLPCFFAYGPAQEACCDHMFSTKFGKYELEANWLCRNAPRVYQNLQLNCDKSNQEECCREQRQFGDLAYSKCMQMTVLGCRNKNVRGDARLKCCIELNSVSSVPIADVVNNMQRCADYRFGLCQYAEWTRRVTCCAMNFLVGTVAFRTCVNNWYDGSIRPTLINYFDSCAMQHAQGSRMFRACLQHPFKVCKIVQKYRSSIQETLSCCATVMRHDTTGRFICYLILTGGKSTAYIYLSYAAVTKKSIEPLSTSFLPTWTRVDECTSKWASTSRWFYLACLSELSQFKIVGDYAFHLYEQKSEDNSTQQVCAVRDYAERVVCCLAMFFPTSSSFETCRLWSVSPINTFETPDLSDELQVSIEKGNKVLLRSQKLYVDRADMTKFLVGMKMAEEEAKAGGVTNNKLSSIFQDFKAIFVQAMNANKVGVIWHRLLKNWVGCGTVALISVDNDLGVMYCGLLSVMDEKPMQRDPVGWESVGADDLQWFAPTSRVGRKDAGLDWELLEDKRLERPVSLYSDVGGSRVNPSGARENSLVATQDSQTIAADSQDIAAGHIGEISIPTDDADTAVIDLFGTSTCKSRNVAFSCYAFCCESYFYYSWVCDTVNLVCVGQH